MKKKVLLSENEMREIFYDLCLYFPNSYLNYSKEDFSKLIKIYYNSLKYYDKNVIKYRIQKYIESEKYFPKVCDLIPTESDFRDYKDYE